MLSVLIPILYTLFYALIGIAVSFTVFVEMRLLKKVWLGLVFGLFGMTWMPSLFSIITGRFSILSHILGAVLFSALFVILFCFRKKNISLRPTVNRFEWRPLLALLPILFIGFYLFSTHILQKKADGLYVGQTTYGDLAMHLGFIASIATQGTFPPQYSIFPGHTVNYPFLCEVSASSLYLFGADLRTSYLISALYAFVLVVLGIFQLFTTWLKKPSRAILAVYLFFIGGGFGFAYFLDQTNSSSSVASILNSTFQTNLSQLLEGYYTTPTNLPDIGLRWVNPIVDMLVPQRATLFGWAFLFPCLTLLHDYKFAKNHNVILPLAFLAGGLPLIHTHSFLALGLISLVYFIEDLLTDFQKSHLLYWLLYGGIAVLLACPQLFGFAFQQVSESSMVKFHFNWANERDSWFWFYIKNWGALFLLLLPALLFLSQKDRRIMSGPLVLWGVSEIVIFQPNTYDNNKLIFVFFAYLCGLIAKFICVICHKLRTRFPERRCFHTAYSRIFLACSSALLIFSVLGILAQSAGEGCYYIRQGSLFTILLLLSLMFLFSLQYLLSPNNKQRIVSVLILIFNIIPLCLLSVLLLRQASSVSVTIPNTACLFILSFEVLLVVCSVFLCVQSHSDSDDTSHILPYIFYRIAGAILVPVLFLSGAMTIARECISSYQVFSRSDLAAAEFIKSETATDSVFLTTYSWHLNTVSVLTGRSIVCGPDLFLYYHGIDTSERKSEINEMYSSPATSSRLFKKYDVSYVYIGPDERYALEIDYDFFENTFEKVYDTDTISIYRISENITS